jgi:hypothetical protein
MWPGFPPQGATTYMRTYVHMHTYAPHIPLAYLLCLLACSAAAAAAVAVAVASASQIGQQAPDQSNRPHQSTHPTLLCPGSQPASQAWAWAWSDLNEPAQVVCWPGAWLRG